MLQSMESQSVGHNLVTEQQEEVKSHWQAISFQKLYTLKILIVTAKLLLKKTTLIILLRSFHYFTL